MPGSERSCGRLFISYSRKNKAEVYPFADALAQAGVDVWIDKEDIDPLDDFPERIRDGLARSQALLAWYSPQYAQSSYCQKELTGAWICARRLTRNVLSRIFILNPQEGVDHIALGDVGRGNYLTRSPANCGWSTPRESATLADCVRTIRDKLAGLSGDFAETPRSQSPQWYPIPQPPPHAARFVGRLKDLWRIHTGLHPVGISAHEDSHVVVSRVCVASARPCSRPSMRSTSLRRFPVASTGCAPTAQSRRAVTGGRARTRTPTPDRRHRDRARHRDQGPQLP